MTGGYRSMADAVGEGHDDGLPFVPGVDFDPGDVGDVGAVWLASTAARKWFLDDE